MTSDTPDARPPDLRGLDPARLVGVLAPVTAVAPKLPGWKILGIAGQGGFGIVWRAEDESDGRLAAIKIAYGDDPETAERIEQEAEALRKLRHPNIVALLDSGPFEGGLESLEGAVFVAMEFIEGLPLSEVIPLGGLEPERAFTYFRQISSAVAHAHSCGILHRDLKPSNILLREDDVLKVADFGLARPIHRRVQQLSLTRAGLVAGTAEYLAPEAYRRDYEPDVRGDVFALGVILYEMLVGTPPRGAWQPASDRRGVDVRIDPILRRALEPDPTRRWSSVGEMSRALAEVLASPPRYSGTPLVSVPVRVADAVWTVAGIFLCLGSLGTVLHVRGSRVDAVIDLIGDHGDLTGGFQALFVLLLASLPVTLWQLARLRRFRAIPLREALPTPFGLRLGKGRMASALVAVGQFVCVAMPFFLIGGLHFLTNRAWLHADDPPWIRGLAVTRWKGGEMVSAWSLPKSGENFWLSELYGPPGHPLMRQVDRIDFEPGWMPGIMVFAALLLLTLVGVTLLRAVLSWVRSGHLLRTVLILGPCSLMASLMMEINAEERRGVDRGRHLGLDHPHAAGVLSKRVYDYAFWLLGAAGDSNARLSVDQLDLYGERVDFRSYGSIPRSEIPQRLDQEVGKPGVREIQGSDWRLNWMREEERFQMIAGGVEMWDGKGRSARSSATIVLIRMEGGHREDGQLEITRERVERIPLYEVRNRAATQNEVEEWVARFFESLRVLREKSDLSALFLPYQIDFHRNIEGDLRAQSENACTNLIASLQEASPPQSAGAPRIFGALPGGRTRVEIPVHDSRTGQVNHWIADLIFHEGNWRCVGFRFGPE